MNSDSIFALFRSVNVKKIEGKYSLYKPLLLLYVLSEYYHGKERLISFSKINESLIEINDKHQIYLEHMNFHYPFVRLVNDLIWEIENNSNLKRSKSGDVEKSELFIKNIHGGFKQEIYDVLLRDKPLIKALYIYLLNAYFDLNKHHNLLTLIDVPINRGRKVALISNEGEPVTGWWISKGIEIIKTERDIFSKSRMRIARQKFIAGSNRLTTIKGWMVAAQLINNHQSPREYQLTNFGLAISENDLRLIKSSTWWSFHLSLCFSADSEPYPTFFRSLETITKDWISWAQLFDKTKNSLTDEMGKQYKDSTIESLLSSVRRMFANDNPLAELGIVEIRKDRNGRETSIRLGSPILSDEIIIHALAMARFAHFKSRESVDFSMLIKDSGLTHFLCCSKDYLRQQFHRMSQMHQWQPYFSFDNAADLDSITFKESCDPNQTVLLLLQKGQDTWL